MRDMIKGTTSHEQYNEHFDEIWGTTRGTLKWG